ncbi:MAG: MFS transporter [Spirochaetota bacterium]|nr:MFS transporter [Spirochaetota bacterium]
MDDSRRNYLAFLWHAVFLSITVTFTEVNTVIPAMILHVGGGEIHVGIVTAIMIGIPLVAQLNFAGLLHGQRRKKPALLLGIHLRVLSLALIAVTVLSVGRLTVLQALLVIYGELLLFTLSGAFAGMAYVDLVGKSFHGELRVRFFTRKQIIASVGILVSAVTARQILAMLEYPATYSTLFAAAAGILLVGTLGFWMIREKPGESGGRRSYLETLRSLPAVLKKDANLRAYLVFVNLIGFHTALTPFYVALAAHRYTLNPRVAGNLLFIQIVGMVSASILWPRVVRAAGFKGILRIWSLLGGFLPPMALLTVWVLPLPVYLGLFLFTGASISARVVSQEAVIVELSTEENRILYAGIVGTLNLSIVIFPVILGGLIRLIGYVPVFLGVSLLSAAAFFTLRRLVCPIDTKNLPLDGGMPM